MRISDWSSDVCSSDLRVLGAVDLERVALGILKRDILEREIVAGDEQPLGARSLLRDRQHGLVPPRALDGDAVGGDRKDAGESVFARGARDKITGCSVGQCLMRSEESRGGKERVST